MITAPAGGRERLERLRARLGARSFAIAAALFFEAVLFLLLLSIGRVALGPGGNDEAIVSFDVGAQPEAAAEDQPSPAVSPSQAEPRPDPTPRETTEPAPVAPPVQAPPEERRDLPFISLSRDEMAAANIANMPARPAPAQPSRSFGPQAPPSAGDSEVVGVAPDGEPLYAARWYREPTDNELAGYLSTASTYGWALIACRTAPQWRVEDCVGLSEYPSGSNIQRAVLAAAWQFQVRPPRRGNQSLVGSWVRIRIEYSRARS